MGLGSGPCCGNSCVEIIPHAPLTNLSQLELDVSGIIILEYARAIKEEEKIH